jgi:prepilin-type N-terminal cleavage/methylation domain-containing protein
MTRKPAHVRHRRHQRGGFTLLELVLVMLLLTIIVGTAMPSLRGFTGWSKTRDAVSQVVALAQYARARAASEAVVYKLNVSGNTYWLTVQTGEVFGPVQSDLGETFELPEGAKIELVPAAGGMRMTATTMAPTPTPTPMDGILFYPDGRTGTSLLRIIAPDGRPTLLGSPSPAEPFRVLSAEEAAQL